MSHLFRPKIHCVLNLFLTFKVRFLKYDEALSKINLVLLTLFAFLIHKRNGNRVTKTLPYFTFFKKCRRCFAWLLYNCNKHKKLMILVDFCQCYVAHDKWLSANRSIPEAIRVNHLLYSGIRFFILMTLILQHAAAAKYHHYIPGNLAINAICYVPWSQLIS